MSCISCSVAAAAANALAPPNLAAAAGNTLHRAHSTDSIFFSPTRSINTGCFAASNAITKTVPSLRSFIREVREARAELDAVLAEINSLEGVLEILKDDASAFPLDLARRTPPLLEHCTSIIQQIEGYMHVCNGLGLTKRDKKFRWMAIKGDMEKLRLTLEGYKSVLALVTDLVGMCVQRVCYVQFTHASILLGSVVLFN